MTTTTARVDVLTAEVRVLMVGSRQVTLSVYRQLDHAETADMTPFGRVNSGQAAEDWVELVGVSTRSVDAGALVRAAFRPSWWHAERARAWRDSAEDVRRQGKKVFDGYNGIGKGTLSAEECERRAILGVEHGERAAQWEALPLIVLAGLR